MKKIKLDNKKYILKPTDDPFNYINDTILTTYITPSSFDHFVDCLDIIKKYTKENNCIYVHTNPTIIFDYPLVQHKNSNNFTGSIKKIPEMTNNHSKISFEVIPYVEHHPSNKCYLQFECKKIIIN